MFERVLVPLDGSSLAESALGLATELAHKFGSQVILLQVVERSATDEAQAQRYLSSIENELRKHHIECCVKIAASNDAQKEIVNCSIREAASLIIMSTHGKSGRRTLEAGSVATNVLTASRVPILFAKPTEYKAP
jgi:nucleotide-binding universal stress UspA family protein